jgi:hypothetical protein
MFTPQRWESASPAVAFDNGLLPIDRNWSYFKKLTLVPQTGPYLTDQTGPDFRY